jgi:hypothetical protein
MPQPDDHPRRDTVPLSDRYWHADHHRHDALGNAADYNDILRDGYPRDRAAAPADRAADDSDPDAWAYTNPV